MDNNELIKKLWQRFHELTRRQENLGAYASMHLLPQRFDQDVLNDIAVLNTVGVGEIARQIQKVRGQFRIAASTGLLGHNDLEELENLLDQVAQ